MKTLMFSASLLIAVAGPASAAVEVLAGWHNFGAGYQKYRYASSSKTADEYMSGISGLLYGGEGTRNGWGSTDGTYGSTYAVETSATDGAFAARTDKPNMYLTVINNTSSDVTLDSIVFDLASVSTNAPQDITLYYDSGDLAVATNTLIHTLSDSHTNGLANVSDYADYDWSLSALADKVLAKGQRAVFRIYAENANNNNQALGLDNIAVLGEGTAGDTLADTLSELKEHINGTDSLTQGEINSRTTIIANNSGSIGNNAGRIYQAFDLVQTYETDVGAMFVSGGSFTRDDTSSVSKALKHAMLEVYQGIIDDAYNTWNLSNHRSTLDGAKFVSANYFPGAVASPADPLAVYSVQINASQTNAWGYEVMFQFEDARRPTGAYLAPGDIATVTVPSALVGKNFKIRVGAHLADLSNKGTVKRFDRVTKTYTISSTSTEIASPLGGGIYIEVPYGIDEGLVTVDIQNAVRSPFYSNSSARQTTLSEWQTTERTQPGKWADFETDKFMITVPRDWIYAYNDPVTLMDNWDLAMDACSDMQGLPRVRPKTVLYCIIDVLIDAGAFSPGYPQSNDSWNPTSSAGGNKDHDLLNGPKFANHVLMHEFGHAAFLTKFSGEVEATVNLPYVPVHNRMFNVPLEQSFGKSLNSTAGGSMNRKHAAINWAINSRFRSGNAMTATEMKYQHRGYAKYVEIAALFGWDALGDFWKSVAVDAENGTTYPRNTDPPDSRIIRMSRAAGANLLPLIHFWGVHPNNASYIESTLASEGIAHSAAIYDRLKYYQSVIPMSAAEFIPHDNAVGNLVHINEQPQYDTWRTTWTSTLGQQSIDAIQDIIDAYFPGGRPIASVPHYEDFENGIGPWAQATDDNFEWRRHSGPTFSPAAGPDGAATGDYYMYAEGHDAGGSYKTASFQCTFDLSVVRDTTLSFDYHMYGDYIDFLAVDVHDGSSWTSNVWIRTGHPHTSSSDPWSSASIDLTSYTGNAEVTIRFRTKNKLWNSADPAIDNISIDVGSQPLPYGESFESGLGAWAQSMDDDLDWTVYSGYTPTTNTGPSGASDGSQYLYVENHDSGVQHKTAMVQCAFDFSTVGSAELTFDYHMYGTYIHYLSVDVSDGTTWTSNVWSRTNQWHFSSEAPWSNAVVDLSAYVGNDEVTIRFRSKQQQWHAADTAIDNIMVYSPYELWALNALAGAPPGTDTSEMGNPDGDSNTNWREWILATDPMVADSPITSMSLVDPNLVITYTRRKIAGISVYAEYSPELVPAGWGTTGFTEVVTGDDGEVETVAVTLSYQDNMGFVRLRVQE